jgi:hypothetical protein
MRSFEQVSELTRKQEDTFNQHIKKQGVYTLLFDYIYMLLFNRMVRAGSAEKFLH